MASAVEHHDLGRNAPHPIQHGLAQLHLLDEGTGFAELRDEVRRTFADELLHRRRLSIGQIAERRGHAETASFITAFKRGQGTTPRASRRPAFGKLDC